MKRLLSRDQEQRLVAAIQAAEKETSGEIVVLFHRRSKGDIYDEAQRQFLKRRLDRTAERNGVLILVAPGQRKLAILGDEGINARVPDGFWDDILAAMSKRFADDDCIGGLEEGVAAVGSQLQTYFPYQSDDVNELADAVQYEE